MTDHEHADILRAIAAGEEMEEELSAGVWSNAPLRIALKLIAEGYGHRLRIKPKPRVPREWWVNVYESSEAGSYAHKSKGDADGCAGRARTECVLVREVIPDAEAKELLERVRGMPWLQPDGARRPGLFLPEDVANAVDAYLERQI